MNRIRKGLTVACVAVGLSLAAVPTAASAAVNNADTKATTNTSSSSCTSSKVWLRLWGSLGEKCYTGNGIEVANLSGVSKEQIIGHHRVCLYTSVSSASCTTGPGTFGRVPPIRVIQIRISTPTA